MMKVRHVYDSRIAKIICTEAITLYPFVFYRPKVPHPSTISHELIHVDQVRKFGWFTFYITYILYYFVALIQYKNHEKAYMNIPYEVEAYENQDKPGYKVIV